jgi:arylsulfatase
MEKNSTGGAGMRDPGDDRHGIKRGFGEFRDLLAEQGRMPPSERPKRTSKTPQRKPSDRVNVLWIMADQLRADTFGCMNHPLIETPNIDRLAAEGAVLMNSFCSSPVCMPSRATFLTGHYGAKHGVIQNGYKMHESEVVFPTLLRDAGYRTANVGKVHSGRGANPTWEYSTHVEDAFGATKPSRVAFDPEIYPGIKFVANMVCGHSDRVLYGCYPGPVKTTKSYHLTTEAMRWLYWHDDPRPFFLRVSYDDPHPPVVPPEPYYSMYRPEDVPDDLLAGFRESMASKPQSVRDYWTFTNKDKITEDDHRKHAACYFGLVSHLDAQIGRLLDYLDELGIADNTIVVLNSDHGHMIGEHGLSHKGAFCYEGVTRIPTLVRWPGRVTPGTRCDALVEAVDFMPTMLDMCGAAIPDGCHGQSLMPLLDGTTEKLRDYAFVQWDDFGYCIRGERWKLTYYDSDEDGELYDLDNDPLEKVNVYHDQAARAVRDELLQKLNQWREVYAPGLGKGRCNA